MHNQNKRVLPIYTSRGDAEAFMLYPFLYNTTGEWIGWITPNREVYSVLGSYVGYLTDDPRILRKRFSADNKKRCEPPTAPPKLAVPARVPLARMMSELTYDIIDVLLDEPERLHTLDTGEFREDLD